MKHPLLIKIGALCAVTLSLSWALTSVQSVVQERQARQHEAEDNVAASMAGRQTLLGPVLTRSCSETWVSGYTGDKEHRPVIETTTKLLRLAATQSQIDANLAIAPRYRGIFKVSGYVTKSRVTAQWESIRALASQPMHDHGQVTCSVINAAVAVTDARGIQAVSIDIGGQPTNVLPGSGLEQQPIGFHASLPDAVMTPDKPLVVTLNVELAGTQSLSVAPVSDSTALKLTTDWPHPSFGGRFLPSERHVSEHGFDATWKVTSLASTAQQEWTKGGSICPAMSNAESPSLAGGEAPATAQPKGGCIETFGVAFVDPVNPYVLSDRATKYGMLFIALTFVAVGLVEVLGRLRVHPIQYLLVGAALTVFFLLLVSLSEHMAFGIAYAAASLACTSLLTFYGIFVLHSFRAGLLFGAGIGTLFGVLYALLQMEQTSLVLGSVLLFVVLAVIMISTRKLDWYGLTAQLPADADSVQPVGASSR